MKIIENIEKRFLEVTGIECNNGITLSKFPLEEGDCSKIENNKEKSDMHGEVFTPLWLVDKMILKASNSLMKAKSTHDLCAGYGQFTVRMLRYLANNKDKFRPKIWLQKIHSFSEYQDSSVYKLLYIFGADIDVFVDDVKNMCSLFWDEKKFDLVFSNPPYNNGMDLKIITAVEPLCKEMVVVHPSTWLLDLKGLKKSYIDFKERIKNKLKSVELFNGNPVFGVQLFVPCVITHMDNEHSGDINVHDTIKHGDVKDFSTEYKVDNIDDITKFGTGWKTIVKPFMIKIKEWVSENNSVWEHNKKKVNSEKYYCQFAAIIGNTEDNDGGIMVKHNFYTLAMKDSEKNKGIRKPYIKNSGSTPMSTFEFDTENHRNNFIDYCKTDFARFCLSIYKNAQITVRGELALIPWMDFTQEWDDEKLYEFFNVNKETQEYIENFLPDYYGIRTNKKED